MLYTVYCSDVRFSWIQCSTVRRWLVFVLLIYENICCCQNDNLNVYISSFFFASLILNFFFETFVQMMITHVEHGNKQIITSTLSWTIWWVWASVNKQHNRKFVHYIWPGCSVQSAKFINRAHRYHFEFLIPFFAISSNPFEVFFPAAHKKVHGQSM